MLYPLIAFFVGLILVYSKAKEQNSETAKDEPKEVLNPGIPKSENTTFKKTPIGQKKSNNTRSPQKELPISSDESKKPRQKKNIPNKIKIEFLQYGITICAAIIGLSTTFYLNAAKAESDKRNHMLNVLSSFSNKLDIYASFLNALSSLPNDSARLQSFLINNKVNSFPFFTELRDPSIYDMTAFTTVQNQFMDNNAKQTIDEKNMNDKRFSVMLSNLKLSVIAEKKQITLEQLYQGRKINIDEIGTRTRFLGDSIEAAIQGNQQPCINNSPLKALFNEA